MPVSIPKPFHNPLANAAEAKFTPETNNVTISNFVTAKHRDSTAAATGMYKIFVAYFNWSFCSQPTVTLPICPKKASLGF